MVWVLEELMREEPSEVQVLELMREEPSEVQVLVELMREGPSEVQGLEVVQLVELLVLILGKNQ